MTDYAPNTQKKLAEEHKPQIKSILGEDAICSSHFNSWNKTLTFTVVTKTNNPELPDSSDFEDIGFKLESARISKSRLFGSGDEAFRLEVVLSRPLTDKELSDIYIETSLHESHDDIKGYIDDLYYLDDFMERIDIYNNATYHANRQKHNELHEPLMKAKEAAEKLKSEFINLSKLIK